MIPVSPAPPIEVDGKKKNDYSNQKSNQTIQGDQFQSVGQSQSRSKRR